MGVSTSSLKTHEQLFEETNNTRQVMSILLEYMLKEITVRDLFSLSNREECKKYVLFMANHLSSYFHELQVLPIRDARGVLVFRKVKDVADPSSAAQKKEKQSLCLILSYFYTRIFQIYGALAITLVDEAQFMTQSGAMGLLTYQGPTQAAPQNVALAPGYRPFRVSGGSIDTTLPKPDDKLELGMFTFLHPFLTNLKNYSSDIKTRYKDDQDKNVGVFFKLDASYQPVRGSITTQRGTFIIGTGKRNPAYLEINAKPDGSYGSLNIILTFKKLKYYRKKSSDSTSMEERIIDLPSDILSKNVVKAVAEAYDQSRRPTYRIGDESVNHFFNELFNGVVSYVKGHWNGDSNNTNLYRNHSDRSNSDQRDRQRSETDTTEALRMNRIIASLRDNRPLGHCIARALQLLRNIPMEGEPGVSQICSAKFYDLKTDHVVSGRKVTTRTGLPKPGSTLDKNDGMAAMALLFYDAIEAASPNIVIGDQRVDGRPSSIEQYMTVMKDLAIIYGDQAGQTARKLSGIRSKRDQEWCKSIQSDINVSPATTQQVSSIVLDLLQTQIQHSAKCGEIFSMLFEFKQDASGQKFITLHDRIISEGFPEIERINMIARELLVKYYTECELKYMNGMQLVLQDRISMNPVPTTPVPTTPVPTTPMAAAKAPSKAVTPVVKAVNAARTLESYFWTT